MRRSDLVQNNESSPSNRTSQIIFGERQHLLRVLDSLEGSELAPGRRTHEKRVLDHLVPLEALGAEPDQLLSYYLWAEDIGPDGNPRRATSDMFFAEVRPFEEIFREGQQQDPNDFSDAGGVWEDLGTFTIAGPTLSIRLSNAANGFVIADAIRIEQL